jgi:exopolyphosphatase/guanosine-5'-triphosphate,3'-diphosphate pyrophosphatase
MLIRIIDIGSNSVKASLYAIEKGEHRLVDKDKLDYSLGDAVFSEGSIPESGAEKVADFIRASCDSKAEEKPHFTFAVATSAVRSAKNRDAFVKRVDHKTGFSVRVLSGAEESFLIHTGITSAGEVGDDIIKTIDIGGGSAEVSWSRGVRYLFGRSYELGAIRLSNRFLKASSFSRDDFDRIYEHALEEFRRRTPEKAPPASRAIGSSGNVRAISKMAQSLRGQPFAKLLPEVTAGTLEDVCELALGRSPQNLASLFDLNLRRARIIMPAVLVLLASLRHFGIPRLELSEAGLREGVAHFWSRHGHLNLPVTEEDPGETGEKNGRKKNPRPPSSGRGKTPTPPL